MINDWLNTILSCFFIDIHSSQKKNLKENKAWGNGKLFFHVYFQSKSTSIREIFAEIVISLNTNITH